MGGGQGGGKRRESKTRAEGPKAVVPTRPTLVLVRHPLPMGEAIEAVGGALT